MTKTRMVNIAVKEVGSVSKYMERQIVGRDHVLLIMIVTEAIIEKPF